MSKSFNQGLANGPKTYRPSSSYSSSSKTKSTRSSTSSTSSSIVLTSTKAKTFKPKKKKKKNPNYNGPKATSCDPMKIHAIETEAHIYCRERLYLRNKPSSSVGFRVKESRCKRGRGKNTPTRNRRMFYTVLCSVKETSKSKSYGRSK